MPAFAGSLDEANGASQTTESQEEAREPLSRGREGSSCLGRSPWRALANAWWMLAEPEQEFREGPRGIQGRSRSVG